MHHPDRVRLARIFVRWLLKKYQIDCMPFAEFVLYCKIMENYHHIWLEWAKMLHRWGFSQLSYLFLSEFSGLSILFAQGVYLLEPFLPAKEARENIRALGALLEDDLSHEYFLNLLEKEGRLVRE
ncbi:MAG: hypothetical protein N3D16_07520 [Anaerolineales bacterium]|nr:hypothetical protein [Anaerolineales bacterium]